MGQQNYLEAETKQLHGALVTLQSRMKTIYNKVDGLMRGVQFYMDINVKTEQMIDADVSNWYRHH